MTKAIFILLFLIIFFFSYTTISNQVKIIPNEDGKYLSYGEESFFLRNSPEGKIYQKNRIALQSRREPWRIAISVPISRSNGDYHSNEFLRGVAVAQDEWNEENKDLQVVIGIADDGYDNVPYNQLDTQAEKETKGAEKVASILVEQEDILAVVGHMGSDVTLAAAPRYKDELVVISPSSTAIREKNDSCTPYEKDDSVCFNKNVFRVTLNDSKAASFLVRAILTKNNNSAQKIERVAIAYDAKSTYSNSFKSAFEKKFESEFGVDSISIEDQCDFSKGNYNGQECWDTVSNKVQAILLIPGELSTAVKVTEDIIAANYDSKKGSRLFLLGSDTMYQENFVVSKGEARSDTKGMLIPITWHRTIENKCSEQDKKLELECKAAQIFHSKEKLEEKSPLAINWRTATSYEATKAILNGLKIAQESNEYCGKRWSLERINLRDCLRTKLKDVLVSDDFNNMQIRGATAIIQFQDGKGNGEIFGERELTKDLGVVVEARNKNFYTFPLKEIN